MKTQDSDGHTVNGHGWSWAENEALFVGNLPGRKQACLYVQHGSVMYPLAFFRSAAYAREALLAIDTIAFAAREGGEG